MLKKQELLRTTNVDVEIPTQFLNNRTLVRRLTELGLMGGELAPPLDGEPSTPLSLLDR